MKRMTKTAAIAKLDRISAELTSLLQRCPAEWMQRDLTPKSGIADRIEGAQSYIYHALRVARL